MSFRATPADQWKAFQDAARADAGLQQKLKAANDAAAMVAMAREAGYLISAEELGRAQAEISEDLLEGLAGGDAQDPNSMDCLFFD